MTTAPPPSVDAWSIFAHSRSAVTSVAYPWRLDYTIAVSGLDGERPVTDHYRARCEPETESLQLFPISDEQANQPPPVPHGFNFSVTAGICMRFGSCAGIKIPAGHPAPYEDLIGEPLIAPTYMFGLRYRSVPQNVKPVGSETALPVIATVSTTNRDYDVTLVGEETVDDVQTYRLRLKPLRAPKDNRLRELWVGTGDYLPRKAVVAGNFTIAPLVDVGWTIDFTVIDGAPFVATETAADTLYLPHHRVVRHAVIAFENIRETASSIYDQPLVQPDETSAALSEPPRR